jgi:hypothetical protein
MGGKSLWKPYRVVSKGYLGIYSPDQAPFKGIFNEASKNKIWQGPNK